MKLRVVALAAFVGFVAVPSTSDACINGVELEIERIDATPAGQVAIAERELADGHPVWAAARVQRQFPNIRSFDAKAPPLGRRAVRLYALAVVRSEGKIDASAGWAPSGNHEWALETLKDIEASTPNNPARQAELAERRSRCGVPAPRACG